MKKEVKESKAIGKIERRLIQLGLPIGILLILLGAIGLYYQPIEAYYNRGEEGSPMLCLVALLVGGFAASFGLKLHRYEDGKAVMIPGLLLALGAFFGISLLYLEPFEENELKHNSTVIEATVIRVKGRRVTVSYYYEGEQFTEYFKTDDKLQVGQEEKLVVSKTYPFIYKRKKYWEDSATEKD